MRKKASMVAIAAAEAAALAEQARRVAEAARLGQLTAGGDTNGIIGQVTCEICFHGEAIGSKKAERLVPCPTCKKTFHRSCLKHWAGNRDLFNWSSWVCGACRVCEVCRRTGDPNKLMFCKRCDEAYHTYCQQPPLKHVAKGPFLCPKHTSCHGCGSRVPGSGFSSRWFLDFTMCDACGRLFVKGKYCSVCLKVYRDSESTPMVCCDNCEHWVHAHCDGISDEKYYEFQLDNNLHYTCAACRGETYKVKSVADAVEELWRRRDFADRDLIRQHQAAAGLPSTEENMKLCPSDDEDDHKSPDIKKPVTVLPSKARDQYEKLSSNAGGKHATSAADAGGGNSVIKKLKIMLPNSHLSTSKSKELPPYAGERGLCQVDGNQHHKPRKLKSDSVVKPTNYMMHARKSMAASNGEPFSTVQRAPTKIRVKSSPVPDDRKGDFSRSLEKPKLSEAFQNPSKSVKFVDNARDKAGTTLHLPFSGEKKETSKVAVSAGFVRATMDGNESQEDGYSSDKGLERSSSSIQEGERLGTPCAAWSSDTMQEGGERLGTPYAADDHSMASQRIMQGGDPLRTRAPNLNYRDKVSRPCDNFEDASVSDDLDSNDASSGKDGYMAKRMLRDSAARMMIEDEDSSGSPRKRVGPSPLGNMASSKHGNGGAVRGQRSKRKKHHSLESQQRPSLKDSKNCQSLSLDRERKLFDDTGALQKLGRDDTQVLQKLGRDAVGKKIEVFCPRDRLWCRGRVIEAPSLQSHVKVRYEDAKVETVEFGTRRVRILSQLGKHARS